MTDGEKAILDEIRSLRNHVDQGFRRAHTRIDEANKELGEVKTTAIVNKTKLGTFTAGMTFVFTGIFALISHYLKSK